MASPIRPPPPPPPAVDPVAPSSPPLQHPSRNGSLSPENPAPPPPPPPPPPAGPTTTPPPHSPDSSPSSPPHPPMPPPLPPSADASPPLSCEGKPSPPRSPPHPSPAPVPPPPAPASSEAKSEQEAAESASESGCMTLALALAQTEDPMPPPKTSSAEASPTGSPQKETAVTIGKLLSGEDPAAAEAKPVAEKVAPPSNTGSLAAAVAVGGGVGSKRWLLGGGVPEKMRRAELRRAELGFRVSAAVFCLVALSVMAADTTTGWSGDSFRRYNEYRYVLAASVVAFTYSGFQLVAEMLAYLLLSASSAALSRNGVWMTQFGGDQFTKLINASASMAFLAFISLGLNSIISAYCVFSLVS
ncbi:hypothetical protein BAE44_0005874 [Dichanthelium oligosanthes]|uniref:CASP-like protein n=1 Tax=Dichanthelium oligosanthes TaxID=888268 RepID=A0A1E5W6S3_9POAL|nr:hypothetical protein BAE44_0005874 [Dichanthelium oligosanthes]